MKSGTKGKVFTCVFGHGFETAPALRTNTKLLDSLEDFGFEVELSTDIGRHVHAVGLCNVPKGLSYIHLVARKE